ncbi:MAG: M20/M25/M40 family metallo-hydrolase [Anaerolineae bacterium]|nr:M20/M25/M40 family metallo-hydrolase [Anaerolineae bacterium]
MINIPRELDSLTARPGVARFLSEWGNLSANVIGEVKTIQAIPSPTFDEGERAAYILQRFQAVRLLDVHQDEVGNVYGRMAGSDPSRPAVMVSAHLDTVFSRQTVQDVRLISQTERLVGPGIGDNSLGLAALIHLADRFRHPPFELPSDIWWVATVGEEGLGDLKGMRRAVETLGVYRSGGRLGVVLVMEGIGLGRVYRAGLGVRRLRVDITGPGGHSWINADCPSAIHRIVELGAALVNGVQLPDKPRSSFNIGLIEGGTSINTRAALASLSIDLRSEDRATLTKLENRVREIINQENPPGELSVSISVVGDRPSASLSADHGLVRAAVGVLEHLGMPTPEPEMGSTDANIPLANQLPAVCIGITTGRNAHTIEEYIDLPPIATGLQQVSLLLLLAANHCNDWQEWIAG